MIASYWRGTTKCMTPANTKNGPKSRASMVAYSACLYSVS